MVEKYELTIDMNALNHLGINLYSNVPAVLSEIIANAWDADAENVYIKVLPKDGTIEIVDDGCGMSIEDANGKFLTVGYRKRDNGEKETPKFHRKVMGRKGIGKLSLFSIANTIEITSVKSTGEKSGFVLSATDIEDHLKTGTKEPYLPKPIAIGTISHNQGTKIVLRDLKKDITRVAGHIKTRLARRFSIIGDKHSFNLFINSDKVTVEDRKYLQHIQYLWIIGEATEELEEMAKKVEKVTRLDGSISLPNGQQDRVTGWVGTFGAQRHIEEGDNVVIINARGKLMDEDILRHLKEGGVFTKYLAGILNAEFLDEDTLDDAATSDRQSIKEDDPRFTALKAFVQEGILKRIQKDWTKFRQDGATEKATQNPAVLEWFEGLGRERKRYAKKLFSTIESFPLEDEQARKELYKHGILAFEKLASKEMLSEIESISDVRDFELLKKVFADMDEIEAVEYYSIAKGRLGVIKKFEDLVDANVKERVIQQHLFDHLWLLDASWERATTDARMEEQVMKEFGKISLTKEEQSGRIDIRYRSMGGRHVIIELKKYGVKVDVMKLCAQVSKYQSALEKCLKEKYPSQPHSIETICILGSPPLPLERDTQNRDTLAANNARFMTYDELLKHARESYSQYVDSQRKVARLFQIIESI